MTLPERRWLAYARRQLTFSKAAGRPGARSREFGPVRGARFAVVVNNGRLTRDAQLWGERHRILWVDCERLGQWAEHGTPLQELCV